MRSPAKGPTKKELKEKAKVERRRLKELAMKKKEMTEKLLAEQNAEVAKEGTGKNKIKYLLKQTDVFAHFMNSEREPTTGPKKYVARVDLRRAPVSELARVAWFVGKRARR